MAEQAAAVWLWQNHPGRCENVSDAAVSFPNMHFYSYLRTRNEVLIHKRVENNPALNRVAREEQEVHVRQEPRRALVENVSDHCVEPNTGIRLLRHTASHMDLVPRKTFSETLQE